MDRNFKKLVSARNPGWSVAETDGAQLEFRVGGFLGQDKQAISDIRNKEDVHRFTAHILNQCEEGEVTKEQRTAAKSDTFKPINNIVALWSNPHRKPGELRGSLEQVILSQAKRNYEYMYEM